MLRTMPRAISLSVKGAAGVGEVFVGVKVDAVGVPPGVGVDLDPVFVEAGASEQLLRISSRQHMMNIQVRVSCGRIRCLSKIFLLTPSKVVRPDFPGGSSLIVHIQILSSCIAQNQRSSLSLYEGLVKRGKVLGDLAVSISSQ